MDVPGKVDPDTPALAYFEELWFFDGNVVLVAHNHAFKVYRGLLARDSEVFSDLFSIPQPSTTERCDNCPVVHLTDRPEDLRHLLRVLMDGKRYYRHDEQLDFTTVAALVLLSHKYQIDYVRDLYLPRMTSCFCTDLRTWEKVIRDQGSPLMKFVDSDAVAAVHIARLTGTDSMLPTAMFTCCLVEVSKLREGFVRLHGAFDPASTMDVLNYINARRGLVQSAHKRNCALSAHMYGTFMRCSTGLCRTSLAYVEGSILRARPKTHLRQIFASNEALFRELGDSGDLCSNCLDTCCRAEETTIRKLWVNLPGTLGIVKPAEWPTE